MDESLLSVGEATIEESKEDELSFGVAERGCCSCRRTTGTAAETPATATSALTNKKGIYR
jgi:hypothetical protein